MDHLGHVDSLHHHSACPQSLMKSPKSRFEKSAYFLPALGDHAEVPFHHQLADFAFQLFGVDLLFLSVGIGCVFFLLKYGATSVGQQRLRNAAGVGSSGGGMGRALQPMASSHRQWWPNAVAGLL